MDGLGHRGPPACRRRDRPHPLRSIHHLNSAGIQEQTMKKIIYTVLATISGLVLIFSYRTSLDAVPPIATTDPAASTGTAAVPSTSDDESSESSGDDESAEGSAGSSAGSG